MIWLVLSILTSVIFGSSLKIAEKAGRNRVVVAFANYVAGAGLTAVYLLVYEGWEISWPTVYIGAIAGVTWVAGLITLMVGIKEVGLAYAVSLARLAVLVPITACLFLWDEQLVGIQIVGVALVCVAMVALCSRAAKREGKITARGIALLVMIFFTHGSVKFVMKLYKEVATREIGHVETAAYMMVLFICAAILTGIWTLAARGKVKGGDFIYGAVAGIPNLFTGAFLILALDAYKNDGSLVFTFWDGTCVFILSLLGVVIWKEKLGVRGVVGIILTIAALVLIKLGEKKVNREGTLFPPRGSSEARARWRSSSGGPRCFDRRKGICGGCGADAGRVPCPKSVSFATAAARRRKDICPTARRPREVPPSASVRGAGCLAAVPRPREKVYRA